MSILETLRTIDFGALDSRFFGVMLKFDSVNHYKKFISLANTPSFPNATFEEICQITAVEHELKHFHDSLLSPVAGGLAILRLNNIINGLPLIYHFQKYYHPHKSNFIPIPITKWVKLNQTKRTIKLDELKNFTSHKNKYVLNPFKIPFSKDLLDKIKRQNNDSDLAARLFIIIQNYNIIQETLISEVESPYGSILPRDIYELNAILVQYSACHNIINAEAPAIFIESLSKLAPEYLKCFSILIDIWNKNNRAIDRILPLFSTWCMLGNRTLEFKNLELDKSNLNDKELYKKSTAGCPAFRFVTIINHFIENGLPSINTPLQDLFSQWDMITKSQPWKTCLNEDLKSAKNRHAFFLNQSLKYSNGSEIRLLYDRTVRVLETIYKNKEIVHNVFYQDPEKYATAPAYLNIRSTLPEPSMFMIFKNFSLLKPINAPESKDYLANYIINDVGETCYNDEIFGSKNNYNSTLDDLKTIYEYNYLLDHLFSSFNREDDISHIVEKFLRPECLEIF